jgi:hypothetical protein
MAPTNRAPIPASLDFETLARGAQFRDRIAIPVQATPERVLRASREVTLADMKLARLLGEVCYLPSRLTGRPPAGDVHKPFVSLLTEGGTLVLRDDPLREIIAGSAGQLHRVIDQMPVRFESREAFETFDNPDYEKLFMSLRTTPTGVPGEQWLVLDHATRALSAEAERRFRHHWRVIKPGGALVSRQLLKAIRRRAEGPGVQNLGGRPLWPPARSVRATPSEAARTLPGDSVISRPKGALTHAITIRRPRHDVWPWLAQMGAGSRAGWYSYDLLDNARQPSASRIIPELQHLAVGMIFPALPGRTDGFTLLAFEPQRFLTIGWLPPRGEPLMTWAFVLEEAEANSTRLIVRARVSPAYEFHGLPWWLGKHITRVVHHLMQRKQLLGIARRAELSSSGKADSSHRISKGDRAVA